MPAGKGSTWSRREFLHSSAALAAAGGLAHVADVGRAQERVAATPPVVPVVVASANGLKAMETALKMLLEKADPLDAVVRAVNIVEDDPTDHSVGLGAIPNEDGVVELDASVMHGPTHKAGAVAALRNIRNPSSVAKLVMRRTDHVLLVGEGALRFARAHGFQEENLLTREAREIWLRWKESNSDDDDWLPAPPTQPDSKVGAKGREPIPRTWGTINCLAVSGSGDIAGVTTTSGLAYKLAGRVGDSPIIGAGLYVDNAVGAAGSTGRGEANLQNCSSFLVVEMMRQGKSPEQACLDVLRRVADHTEPRLRDSQGRAAFDLKLYAVAKDGRFGAASMWSGGAFAVCDVRHGSRKVECAYLYKSPPRAGDRK